ncbi:MAG: toxin-antitoxin system YwqK family antitoxin [Jejuia sp.]
MKLSVLYIALLAILLLDCNSNSDIQTVDTLDEGLTLHNGILLYQGYEFDGVVISNYDTGEKLSQIEYKSGKKHGQEIRWYKTGDQLLERFYVEGYKTGIHRSWWPNRNLKFEYHFNEKGEHHGVMNEWCESGQPLKAFNFENGKELGTQKLWKHNGNIKANYEVVNGERFGLIGLKKCYIVTVDKDEIK